MVKKSSVVRRQLSVARVFEFGLRLAVSPIQDAIGIHFASPLQSPPHYQDETTDHGQLITDEGRRSKNL